MTRALNGSQAVFPTWASGNSVVIQCAWNVDPGVHWNATEERIRGSHCVSSGFQ